MGNFGFGVLDFLKRNDKVRDAADIMSAIYTRSSKFKRGNPVCRLYYVTTGKWTSDATLEARRQSVVSDLRSTNLFRDVEFVPVDAEGVQRLYRQTKNAVSRDFIFANRTVVPEVPGVTQAYLGFLPVPEFLKLIEDDGGRSTVACFIAIHETGKTITRLTQKSEPHWNPMLRTASY